MDLDLSGDRWIIYAAIFSLYFSSIACCIHLICCGTSSNDKVRGSAELIEKFIKKERIKDGPGAGSGYPQYKYYYYAKFRFIDDQSHQTHSILTKVIQREMRVEIDHEWQILPIDIVGICISYIDYGDLKVYYGPFSLKRKIDYTMYDQLPWRGTINIEYDPKNPRSARPKVYNKQSTDKSWWNVGVAMYILICGLCCYFSYEALMSLKDLHRKIRMMYSVVVGSLIFYLIFLIGKRILACYHKIRRGKLHIEWTSNV